TAAPPVESVWPAPAVRPVAAAPPVESVWPAPGVELVAAAPPVESVSPAAPVESVACAAPAPPEATRYRLARMAAVIRSPSRGRVGRPHCGGRTLRAQTA